MKSARIVILIAGTSVILLLLRTVLLYPALAQTPEAPVKALSHYLMDAEFLQRCANNYPKAVQNSTLLSPEMRFAVLQHAGIPGETP